jgi:hypothetical protein
MPLYPALSDGDRVKTAKAATAALVDHAIHLLSIHFGNEIVGYSDKLASQIPVSHAANAFNVFRDAYFKYEVTRLCALWDTPRRGDTEMQSIPAVVALIARPSIEPLLHQEQLEAWRAIGGGRFGASTDPTIRAIEEDSFQRQHEAFSQRQAAKQSQRLQTAVLWSNRVLGSARLQSVKNARDKSIAHSLLKTRLESKQAVAPMRYGDERYLLWKSVAIINNLYLGINGVSLDWHESISYAKSNAEELWNNTTFSIPR